MNMNNQPKIKLLIPVEIKEGCELPEVGKTTVWIDSYGHEMQGKLSMDKTFIVRNNFGFMLNEFTHYRQEQETDLTIDELKKIGVIK